MTLSALKIAFSFKNKRFFKKISINKLKQELPWDLILSVDRASYCLFKQTPILLNPQTLESDRALYDGAMGIKAPTQDYPELINPAVYAIHLQNVELFPKARLLIYDREFVISDYLGEGGHEVAKKWLNKQWSIGPLTLSRSKAIPPHNASL